jgi:hypothetical protein
MTQNLVDLHQNLCKASGMDRSDENGTSPNMLTNTPTGPQAQREVQRLLGRCMLQLQQYERLLKAVLAHHELAGTVDTLEAQRSSRVEKLSDKTLGHLVKALFESHVVPDGFERELLPTQSTPTDQASFAFSFRITMPPARWADMREALEALVNVRNDLVHHFIAQFDLHTDEGCVAAIAHLTATGDRIDKHHREFEDWAKDTDAARSTAAQILQSDAFREVFVNGIAPDGSFDWPSTGIVSALRESSKLLAMDGWTSLASATAWIQSHHPEQVPQKYGCRSWPQVLQESNLFDLTYRVDADGKKIGWFKERSRS